MMFQVGEYVIYGNRGVCKVDDITHLDLSGANKENLYYCLVPISSKSGKIYTPVDNNKVVMRNVLTKDEAISLIDSVPKIDQIWALNDKQLEQEYKGLMHNCNSKEWFRIIKTIYSRRKERSNQRRKLTATDERYLKAAEESLYSELSVALGIDKSNMEEFIIERINRMSSNLP